ncbi:hypothetical protein [Bacillus thuringiensis]|uniref:hypothetical protein n=1 Tax=Bacillus thuringiensis TaxID=1428 RepID=UPI000BEB791C|nr:hypothetical protein [Bacillus thuringiensis]PDZ92562.1 hypothetical protein CON47_06295 [Bacillus thuringiensis]
MADAPKLQGTEKLGESYYKINMGIDNANEALKKSFEASTVAFEANSNATGAVDIAYNSTDIAKEATNVANEAVIKAQSVQKQLDTIVVNGDSSIEAAQARVDNSGNAHTSLKSRLDYEFGILSKNIEGRGINVLYPPAPLVAAKGDGIFDDTAIFQAIANTLPADGELFIPKGTFLIGQVNFPNGRQNIKIRGNGTIKSKVGDYTANFVFGQYTYYVEITGITFVGLKGQVGAPTTYTPDKNAIIKISDGCGYFKIEKNRFLDHMGHFIVAGAIAGNDVEMGHTIEKNVFRNMVDLNDNRQCAILMKSNCQYSEVINNKFYNCQSAIHSLSANNKINFNNIEGGTLNIVGLPATPTLSDYFAAKQAWIVCSYEGDPLVYNSAKTQIIGNKINHTSGNAPALICEGSFSRNEGYFNISDNEILINRCDYSIMLKRNTGTRILNNSIGNTVANAHKAHIAIFESKSITLDKNNFIGDYKTAILEGAEFYDGLNTFDKMGVFTANYEYITNANIKNKRRPRVLLYSFSCVDGSKEGLATQHTVFSWGYTKNAVGNYTVTHNIGHTGYTVTVSGYERFACVKNLTANTFDILVYSLTGGTLQNGAISGALALADNRNGGYYNLTSVPERIV